MESRAKLFGHSIHQMLIVFPLGVGVDDGAHLNAPSSIHGPVTISGTTTRTHS